MSSAVEIEIKGDADKLVLLAHATKALGDTQLRKELLSGLQRAARPLKAAAAAGAASRLPRGGHLNDRVARSKFTARTRTTPRTAGVRIVGAGNLDLRSLDRGRVRHPVFGHRKTWVNQHVTPGWFTDAMQKGSPIVRAEIGRVLDDVAVKLIEATTRG